MVEVAAGSEAAAQVTAVGSEAVAVEGCLARADDADGGNAACGDGEDDEDGENAACGNEAHENAACANEAHENAACVDGVDGESAACGDGADDGDGENELVSVCAKALAPAVEQENDCVAAFVASRRSLRRWRWPPAQPACARGLSSKRRDRRLP